MNRSKLMNIPREQYKALIELSKNKDIIITSPDKGSGVVILNRSDYVAKMEEILKDTTKFKKCGGQDAYEVSRKTERKVRNFLRDKVKKPGYITDDEYKKLYPNGSHIGVFYGVPKVHKEGIPTRPLCSAIATSTYNLGRYLVDIIRPASYNCMGTDLENTLQFVDEISSIDISAVTMISFDVKSLFTNVPLKKVIKVCLDRLYRRDPNIKPSVPEDVLGKLLKLCVCDNTFIFNDIIYEQIDGLAMGSSQASLMANV